MTQSRVLISILFLSACHIGLGQVYLDSSYTRVDRDQAVYYQTLGGS